MCLGEDNYVPYIRFLALATAATAVTFYVLYDFVVMLPGKSEGLFWDMVGAINQKTKPKTKQTKQDKAKQSKQTCR